MTERVRFGDSSIDIRNDDVVAAIPDEYTRTAGYVSRGDRESDGISAFSEVERFELVRGKTESFGVVDLFS